MALHCLLAAHLGMSATAPAMLQYMLLAVGLLHRCKVPPSPELNHIAVARGNVDHLHFYM